MHWLRRRLKVFLFLALVAILERNGLSIFGRQSPWNIPVKLFQNLSIDLAEEVVKSIFLFIALAAILFNISEFFEQFWQRVTQETFLYNCFKINPLVPEKKSFKGFSVFSSSSHLVQRSGTVRAILVEGHPRNIP